jgi:DNA-damage-inducible protein J
MTNGSRLSVRVDPIIKRQAEDVFAALGMNMTTGINIFLSQVAQKRAIPFALKLDDGTLESRMRSAADSSINKMKEMGVPVALFDEKENRPYLEYPDGRKTYDIG